MIRYKVTGTSPKIEKLNIVRESITHIYVKKANDNDMLHRIKKGAGDSHFPTLNEANEHLVNVLTSKVNSIKAMLTESNKDLKLVKSRIPKEEKDGKGTDD